MNDQPIPRRIRVDQMTTAELAIRDTIAVVERAGAHPLLTDAVTLLGQAQAKVADYVDAHSIEHDIKLLATKHGVVLTPGMVRDMASFFTAQPGKR
ncbi:hypothetical protein [Taklimakanibacter albus]|uniref:Uncharacterized protein n=1 Tax=Taklimakanibacter albus TaxID=2800327 RepID=A0ACC5R794_9HYPH|nr:hypothetical protein [Aestuariivirga sp. YIM B02566]MBK1868238.1 hypothetical protein [Aestuariivirga sp. YIM B02566]